MVPQKSNVGYLNHSVTSMYCNANLLHTNAQMTCTAKVKTKKTIELDLAIFPN